MLLEICCYSAESALNAEKCGANRIELCDNYSEGGTTPSLATIQYLSDKLKIPINVIVRPRGGDFLYSDIEYEIIKNDVELIKSLKINGIVVGFLTADGEIDLEKTKEIADLAYPMELTFHRAFDMCKNPLVALEQLKKIGVKRILTSGAKNTVLEGIELIAKLVKQANNEIIIMPGSGINKNNLNKIIFKTKALEYHSSAKTLEHSKMTFFNKNISMGGVGGVNEFKKITVDHSQIKTMSSIIKSKS